MSEIICINCSVKRDNAEGIFWAVGNGVYQCSSCREKSRRAGIAFRQDVGFSHQSTDEAVCPHCGYEYSDSWEMREHFDFIHNLKESFVKYDDRQRENTGCMHAQVLA